ncbi:diaminopimelate decarboxylase [Aminipila butyrica]|uniref:Diaminopimelate decarboxylase n=1 Tax=Aminipila butyrica TaxID=433296 RepID=A0A858C088_9FIRM|nr:diaminopimelate decarboxylase [Aminipila butyrica]QIB70630.1 diaminopimelate decarboxylase [Aminipila butyrica]
MILETHNSNLYFDGCDTIELAKEYGTPLFVMSETAIVDKCQELKKDFLSQYENTRVAYAAKAFLTTALCKILEREGFCIDVVSGGELYTCISAGFPSEKIEFNGNNKSEEEISMAIDYQVGRIIVDNPADYQVIQRIAREKQKKARILFRITPEIKIDTHAHISTGQKDSKFGVPLNDSIFYPLIQAAIESEYIEFLGFHFHLGSQIFDNQPYINATIKTLDLIEEVRKRYNYTIQELNVGGGFGIRYTEGDSPKPYSYFLEPVMKLIYEFFDSRDLKRPSVVIEPGRSFIGESGITLYTIGNIKEIPDVRTYVSVDGGMTDNIRPALYDAVYEGAIANKMNLERHKNVTICGKCCESGDILIKNLCVPNVERGDILTVFNTGAYCFSMSSNYNKNRLPAVVLTKEGKARLIVKRQSYQDLIERELV